MSRLLGSLALLGALLAVLSATVLVPATPAAWLPSLVAILAVPFFLLGEGRDGRAIGLRRNIAAYLSPIVLLALALAALAANIGEINTEGTTSSSPIPEAWGATLAVLTSLALPALALAITWWELPAWARYEGAGTIAVSGLLAVLIRDRLVDVQNDPVLLLMVLVTLAAALPAILILKGLDA